MVVTAPLAEHIIERLKDEEVTWIAASLDEYWAYMRQQNAHHWLNEDYATLDMAVSIGDFAIPMQDIYHKVAITTPGATNA